MRHALISLFVLVLLIDLAWGQDKARRSRPYPPKIDGAKKETYKTIGDVKLNMYIFTPEDHKAADRRAAIVFFFGGGWRSGSPAQFTEQCKYLASRGMVAMSADYRVLSRHKTKAVRCVEDAKSAIRWIRANAERLGVDPQRIVAGGGSAGGHIAACTGVIKQFDNKGEDASISSMPNAMALFNPALVLASVDEQPPLDKKRSAGLAERMGVEPFKLSPYHHIEKDAPPTIVFHGKKDTTVPYHTAESFAAAMRKAGNRCRLVGYEDDGHGFFNHGRGGNKAFDATMRELDKFLSELGFLEPSAEKS